MNRFATAAALGAAALTLAACGGWSSDPPMRGNAWTEPMNVPAPSPEGGGFDAALARNYAAYSAQLDANGQWADADYFARKGAAAASGAAVPPERNGNWLVPLEVPYGFRTQLAAARARLVPALAANEGTRPELAARAEVSYDCWTREMEADWKTGSAGSCRSDFQRILGELEARPKPVVHEAPRQRIIHFAFDRAEVRSVDRPILAAVAAEAKTDPALTILLVGKADHVGCDCYNMRLSRRRAAAAAAVLEADGVAASRITEKGVGWHEPRVPAKPGVPTAENRVVEIDVSN